MADPQKFTTWLGQRFDRIVHTHTRQKRITDWNRTHEDEKNAAQREIEWLSALLDKKNHKLKHQALISPPSSHSPAPFPAHPTLHLWYPLTVLNTLKSETSNRLAHQVHLHLTIIYSRAQSAPYGCPMSYIHNKLPLSTS